MGRGLVKPIQSKVEAILSFPAPSSRCELRRFLGMAGYYRSFCGNFSAAAAPLTDLLSPKRRYHWSESCQHAFDCIKALMTHASVLAAPQFDRPFKLSVNASDAGAGQSYSRREMMAWNTQLLISPRNLTTINGCIPPLRMIETEVFTDHNPLVFVQQMKNSNQRPMRWALFLQSFNIIVHHVKSTKNVLADTLSRSFSDV